MRQVRRILPVLLLVHVLFGTAATAQSTLSYSSYLGSTDETVITIPAGGAGNTVSSGSAPQVRAGYASASINQGPTPYGTAVLSLTENGVTVSEAGLPASGLMTAARLFIDFRNNVSAGSAGTVNVNTGIMMVNPGSAPATISLRLLSLSGQVIATGSGSLNGDSHVSLFVNELHTFAPDFVLPADLQFASLEISSTMPICLTGLRIIVNQRGETLMASTPVADLSLAPSTATLVVPQFADGGGFTNTLILLNTSASTENGNVSFRDDTGTVVPMTLNGVSDSTFAYEIPAGGAQIFETDGSSATVEAGWIDVEPAAGTNTPVGSGMFRFVENGIDASESAVPASQPGTHMRVSIDTSNGRNTAITFANPGNTDLTIHISTASMDGAPAASQATLTIPALGHISKFIGELVTWDAGLKGVADISASGPVAVSTLRTLVNQRGEILLTSLPVADLSQPAPTPIFPQIVDGGGFQTETILISPGTDSASAVTIGSVFTDNETVTTIPAGGAGNMVSSGSAPQLRAGYASTSINQGPTPYGTAVLSLTENGVTVSEAGLPASELMMDARMFIDYRNNVSAGFSGSVNVNTGIMMFNPGSAPATIRLRLLSLSGQAIATGSGSLNGDSHLSLFVNELQTFAPDFGLPGDFADSVRFASLEISSSAPISLAGLRIVVNQRGETLMSSTPVADLSLAPSTATLVVPQFADGGGFTNTLILLNTAASTENGNISFRDDTGTVVPMTLNGVSDSTFAYEIPAGGAQVFETDGSSATVKTGWIDVEPAAGTNTPAGSGMFRFVENGIDASESVVPASQPGTHMRLSIDTSNGHNTAITFANPGNTDLTIHISTASMDGAPVTGSQTTLTLPALGHISKFIGELVTWDAGLKGVAEISTSGPVAVSTLRTLVNQRSEILLTSLPVADMSQPALMPIFPQIVDGGGFQTEIIFINPEKSLVSATVQDTFN